MKGNLYLDDRPHGSLTADVLAAWAIVALVLTAYLVLPVPGLGA